MLIIRKTENDMDTLGDPCCAAGSMPALRECTQPDGNLFPTSAFREVAHICEDSGRLH